MRPLRTAFRIRATVASARLMIGPPTAAEGTWQAAIEVIGLDTLVPETGLPLAGRPAPPWGKEGWFHAFRLLADYVSDPRVHRQAVEIYQRLTAGVRGAEHENGGPEGGRRRLV